MRMIFIFIDGFGIGEENVEKNPFFACETPTFDYIFNKYKVIETDACLGVKGLPQSATGQTTIFTGKNASKIIGKHLHAQPSPTLIKVIEESNLFLELIKKGYNVTNSNVYRNEYIQNIMRGEKVRPRPSVTTIMTLSTGARLRSVDDLNKDNGIYHDITSESLKNEGYNVLVKDEKEAAQVLYKLSKKYDFTLYEHFITDILGHKQNMELAIKDIQLLDKFLKELLSQVNLDEDMIIITSDHGNIEDLSIKTHTFNKVPTVIINNKIDRFRIEINSLTDIMNTVLEIFEQEKINGEEKNRASCTSR